MKLSVARIVLALAAILAGAAVSPPLTEADSCENCTCDSLCGHPCFTQGGDLSSCGEWGVCRGLCFALAKHDVFATSHACLATKAAASVAAATAPPVPAQSNESEPPRVRELPKSVSDAKVERK
jgi:hypothetical protein